MTLTKSEYYRRIDKLSRLVWDISSNIEFPNPHCEKELYEAIESCTKLLIQLKTYHEDGVEPRRSSWWCPEIKKEGDRVSFDD